MWQGVWQEVFQKMLRKNKQLPKLAGLLIIISACFLPTVAHAQIKAVATENPIAAAMADSVRLLTWLGLSDSVAQIDALINYHTGKQSLLLTEMAMTEPQATALRQQLSVYSSSTVVGTALERYFANHLPAVSEEAKAILSQALPTRVRNFDVVWSMSSVEEKWQAYQQAMQNERPSEQRKALMLRLDKAMQTSIIAAFIQTEIDTLAKLVAAEIADTQAPVIIDSLIQQQLAERQQLLEAEIVDLHLFSYRYMKDDELARYVELMEAQSIKASLTTAYQGLQTVMKEARNNALAISQ